MQWLTKTKLASSATETEKANLGGVSTTLPIITFAPNSAHTMRTDHGPAVNRGSEGSKWLEGGE